MAYSRATLFILFNILFFTLVSSTYVPCPPPPSKGGHGHSPPGTGTPPSKAPRPVPSPGTPSKGHGHSPPGTGTPPSKGPRPVPSPGPEGGNKCPKDTLKLGVCAILLNDLVNVVVGSPPQKPNACCSLIGGLADLDAAVCLCTAIRANVLGINLNVPVSLSLLLNYCGKKFPSGFQCE
ncbi:hypothetical protein RD792_010790 [Penstemon davidsonii]|uniref:Bifunctional inhibitor/plant lipid transfer protein/seed storage helical domain-containing protein n=1 Tax=Penstemon davidsonii TaxID=160366 RepID=A0ABR0D3X8_9LAMI|nr:hypothetical protein RD792_010790 [Penstemon davidsonii]